MNASRKTNPWGWKFLAWANLLHLPPESTRLVSIMIKDKASARLLRQKLEARTEVMTLAANEKACSKDAGNFCRHGKLLSCV